MESITVGIDLAKQVFSVCVMEAQGRVTQRRELKREGLAEWLAQLPAGAVVAMEACSSAHYWGRLCLDHGLQPRLMAAQFVKPFRKSAVIKNDRNDAEAIATAARQGNMRFIGARLPFGKVLVAIANKHARQIWAMLARDEAYDPQAWLKHPMVQRG